MDSKLMLQIDDLPEIDTIHPMIKQQLVLYGCEDQGNRCLKT